MRTTRRICPPAKSPSLPRSVATPARAPTSLTGPTEMPENPKKMDHEQRRLTGALVSYRERTTMSTVTSGVHNRGRLRDCEEALDHGIDLIRHLKLDEVPRSDGAADDELWAQLAEALQLGVWVGCLDV